MSESKLVTILVVGAIIIIGVAIMFKPKRITSPESTEGITEQVEGLTIETLVEGTGEDVVKSGNTVLVHYEGKLNDGTIFDSSFQREKEGTGGPVEFGIGIGQVIKGWDQGIPGMKVGERRKLVISPELAYGVEGRPGIPSNATLTFEVELIEIK